LIFHRRLWFALVARGALAAIIAIAPRPIAMSRFAPAFVSGSASAARLLSTSAPGLATLFGAPATVAVSAAAAALLATATPAARRSTLGFAWIFGSGSSGTSGCLVRNTTHKGFRLTQRSRLSRRLGLRRDFDA
jgi:hypothetical protein